MEKWKAKREREKGGGSREMDKLTWMEKKEEGEDDDGQKSDEVE